MNVLMLCNHGTALYPKEGADIRRNALLMGLMEEHNVFVLESNRFVALSDRRCAEHFYPNLAPDHVFVYREYYLLGKPLSPFVDLNLSFMALLWKIIWKHDIDAIIVSFPYGMITCKLFGWLAWVCAKRRILLVYDAHNVEVDLARESSKFPLRWFLVPYVSLVERMAVRLSDFVTTINARDKARLRDLYHLSHDKVTVIPPTVRINYPLKERKAVRNELGISSAALVAIFHGTYHYLPNKEAIDYIVTFLAPRFVDAGVVFVIAGKGVPVMKHGNVSFVGFQSDIYSLLHACDIALVPLTKGGGTKMKLIDYLTLGLPILATSKAIEGVDALFDGRNVMVADLDDFPDKLEWLVFSKDMRARLAVGAREFARRQYGWDAMKGALKTLMQQIEDQRTKLRQCS